MAKKKTAIKTKKTKTPKDGSRAVSKQKSAKKPRKNANQNAKQKTKQNSKQPPEDNSSTDNIKFVNHDLIELLGNIALPLSLYHRHEVAGLGNIPKKGKVMIVVNHSLATYDIALLIHAIYKRSGRLARPLIDRLFYKIPFLGELMDALGCSSGSKENAQKLLDDRQMVIIAPGGMREALRPSSEKYQTKWGSRKGFAKMSLETQTPIILAVCPKADDLYKVYPSAITKWMYKNLKIPIFFARGLGPTPIPRPVKLKHFLSAPIKPPRKSKDPEKLEAQVTRYHKKIMEISSDLMTVAMEKNLLAEPTSTEDA